MNVLILTEGGRERGFGHIIRCICLEQAFVQRGIVPQFLVNGDESAAGLLKGRDFCLSDWLKERKRLSAALDKADAAVVDSYLAEKELYQEVAQKVEAPLYFDDNKRIEYPRGIVLNSNIYAEELDYAVQDGKTFLLGSRYAPLREAFRDVPEKQISERIEKILVTFGAGGQKELLGKVLEFLQNEYPDIEKNAVIGGHYAEPEQLKDKKINFIYTPGEEKIKQIIQEADLAVSAGGQTLHELARMGLPAIAVCVAENQLRNCIGWEKKGFLRYIGWYNDEGLIDKLKSALDNLQGKAARQACSNRGRESIDGRGAQRVVKAVLAAYVKNNFSLRAANMEDMRDVFDLSNDDIVRSISFNPQKIEWNHHRGWFKERIDNRDCVFLVCVSAGKFAGQLRFNIDADKKEATVNISLVKDIRGLGLGAFILEKAADELSKIRKDIRLIKAYVQQHNLASIKAFRGARFEFLEDTVVKGKSSRVYVRSIGNGR